ncbi:hypothetical protein ABK040_006183 [Willaertia magna]
MVETQYITKAGLGGVRKEEFQKIPKSNVDRMLHLMEEIYSDIMGLINEPNKWDDNILNRMDSLSILLNEVINMFRPVGEKRVISGHYSAHKIENKVKDLLDMDLFQLNHVVEKLYPNDNEKLEQGKKKIIELRNGLEAFSYPWASNEKAI